MVCAECGVHVGTGHVMRCLALAQAWKRAGGSATFVLPEGLVGIEERIRAEGFLLRTLPKEWGSAPKFFVHTVLRAAPPIAVLDGYSFGEDEQTELTSAGIQVLTVDDYGHATGYPVRWVLNQNVYTAPEMYASLKRDSTLLLGPAYALLRDEFLTWIGWKRSIPDRARKILVTIGGSDSDNASEQILDNLALLDHSNRELEVILVAGSGNPHLQSLQRALERCPVSVRMQRGAHDMAALMAWADVAIAGAGVTSYELCYMGLPSILLIVAENQRRIAEGLSQLGGAVNAGTTREYRRDVFANELQRLIDDSERRQTMSRRARDLIDGMGSERVRAALLDRGLKLRPAHESDCELLFEWAQDREARTASFHPAPISWEDHGCWFRERLHDPHSVIYIGENADDVPAGVVRFQLENDSAVLSVNVAARFRGKGWGRELVSFATNYLCRARSVGRVKAFVKPENQASVRLFEASGFRRAGTESVAGQVALLFTWECKNRTHAS